MADDSTTYRDSGVDLEAGYEAVRRYKSAVARTRIPGVVSDVGGFGGLFALRDAGISLNDPVLVSATDGVGTKLRLAFDLGIHRTIGVDCVAMCVNDVITTGAAPLFFLDYLATGKLDPREAAEVVEGIADACAESGCALIGGETAEMPGFYPPGEYDLAGFCVGVVERSEILDRERVREGDAIVGIASTGFHSNGYSLVRKIVADRGLALSAALPSGRTLGESLLTPTRLYPKAFAAMRAALIPLKSAANITGGGFYENVPRALPDGLGADIDPNEWPVPEVVQHIADAGNVRARERYSVFNMGIGMTLMVDPAQVGGLLDTLEGAGYAAWDIGRVTAGGDVRVLGVEDD